MPASKETLPAPQGQRRPSPSSPNPAAHAARSIWQGPASESAVAIVGMAFRLPGDLGDEASLWQALQEGRDLVTQVPPGRWATDTLQHPCRAEPGRSITFSAGVLSRIDEFDAGFFGIAPREAAWMDPQQRLLLELAWETMENAGIAASSLAGSDCAVYVGISSLDYGTRGLDDLASMTAHSMTGNTLSIAANRLSYVFDLHGPSLAVDTACSSSLVALHHACNSLRSGEASMALVGGVSLLLHPYPFIGFTKASMLSAGGRCKPFDASGDGYVRAEGAAVLLLKPLQRALVDGDNVQAVILASGVNADGARKSGITIPSSAGQAELMRQVLARSGLAAHDIDFIEAHGTGTAVGDPVESAAIGAVYGQGRTQPLPIGSVKANLGHLEAASGMAGLIKAILALRHRALPPTPHLHTLNPHIDFAALNLAPVRSATPLRQGLAAQQRPLVAGVNSFGFGGANAHVLLQEFLPSGSIAKSPNPGAGCATNANQSATGAATAAAPMAPLRLSARTPQALRVLAQRYADWLDGQQPQAFYAIARSAALHREHLEQRLLLQAPTLAQACSALRAHASGKPSPHIVCEEALTPAGGLAFVYSGNGAQWAGMGQALLAQSPRFAQLLTQLDEAMRPQAGFALLPLLQAGDAQALQDTTVAQPLLFAIQVALTLWLREQGIAPDATAGHSVGEIAAAWAAGALTLEQAITVICARSQAQGLTRGQGRMAALGLSEVQTRQLLAELGLQASIEIAGINSPGNITLAGPLPALQRLEQQLAARATPVFFRLLELDYAFHSRVMDAIEDELAQRLSQFAPGRASAQPFVSTVTGTQLEAHALNADYWWRNVREPVQFQRAVATLAQLGCTVFVEIGPHAILQRYITESLQAEKAQGRALPSLQRGNDGPQRLTELAGRLHLLGDGRSLQQHFPKAAPRVPLPNYPWQRERHWHPNTSESLQAFSRQRLHPLLGWPLPEAEAAWGNVLDVRTLPWLADHQVGGAIVYPGAAYADMALAAARQWLGAGPLRIEQLDILAPMVLEPDQARSLRLVLQPRDGSFQISSRARLSSDDWTLHAAGRILQASALQPSARIVAPESTASITDAAAHYHRTQALGLQYGPAFQGLRSVQVQGQQLQAQLQLPAPLSPQEHELHPALLDLCFQTLADFFGQAIDAGDGIALLPTKIGRLELLAVADDQAPPITALRAQLRRHSHRSALADFELLDEQGRLRARLQDCRFRAAHLAAPISATAPHWHISAPLTPHPCDSLRSHALPIASLRTQAEAALAPWQAQRQAWFTQTLPLCEALTLSFAYQAFAQLAAQAGPHWHQCFSDAAARPYAFWLAQLLQREQLLTQPQPGQWQLTSADALPAAGQLWQAILHDSPASLPQLMLLARVGAQLPSLLQQGSADGMAADNDAALALLTALRRAPAAEALYSDDPAYCGIYLALQAMLREAARRWPATQRLRVLEIAAGPSLLALDLAEQLPDDRLDYVLALPDAPLQERLQAQLQAALPDRAAISVTGFDPLSGALTADRSGPQHFDLVLLHHSLHLARDFGAALAQAQQYLAEDGLLLLAERHPDWSASLLEGLDSAHWRLPVGSADSNQDEAPSIAHAPEALPALLPPQAWQQLLKQQDWRETCHFAEPAAQGLAEGAYLLLARRPAMPAKTEAATPPPTAAWLLMADAASAPMAQALRQALHEQGQQAQILLQHAACAPNGLDRASNAGTGSRTKDTALLDWSADTSGQARRVIYLRGWDDAPEQAAARAAEWLDAMQRLANQPHAPHLWLVTRGGALCDSLPEAAAHGSAAPNPAQAALWGMGRVAMNELPQLACTLIELACDPAAEQTVPRLLNECLHPDGLDEILLTSQTRHALQLHQAAPPGPPPQPTSRWRLDFHVPGQLRNLVWLPEAERPLQTHEVEVRTMATGLNFRDVMYLMGLLPDEAVENGFAGASLGLEFSGVVHRVGAQVKTLRPGDAVVGFGPACFASHVVTPAHALAPMPAHWSFEAAATVPTVFFTVYYALVQLADLQPGERVLIHGAAGGVGMAAIALAQHLGAEVYASAGSEDKRDFVRLLGVERVFDSRSLDFADALMQVTHGQGVDVVLNSLAGEAMRRSLELLRPFGRFLELGKRDFFENTPLGLRPMRNNISYFGIDADQLLTGRPALAAKLFGEVMALLRERILAPLPYRAFPAERIVEAFRAMQQARHIGKIVVSMHQAQPEVKPAPAMSSTAAQQAAEPLLAGSGAWLVSGGLSGFGLASARWLAQQGVRQLALIGRRGADTPGAAQALAELQAQGVQVRAWACDVSDAQAVDALIAQVQRELPPLTGVLHAAAVFDDQILARLDAASLQRVLHAKLLGAWNLHRATRTAALQHFIVYSSITTAIGNPGQANYVAANAGLQALTALRQQQGLPATCMAWGPIADVGYLSRNDAVRDSLAQRLGRAPMSAEQALTQLGRALRHGNGQPGFTPADFDWNALAPLLPGAQGSRFAALNRLRRDAGSAAQEQDIRSLIASKTPEQVLRIVQELVAQQVAKTLGIAAERIAPERSLHDLGMDSLMAVELALGLEQRLGVQLPVMMLNDAPSVHSVSARIVTRLGHGAGDDAHDVGIAQVAHIAAQHGEGLSAEDIEALSADARQLAQQGARLIP
ncbi:type I polyketide synthase [Vandammella animalimorsus]|uniref:Type I polyketide synthase WcbR n=1 Tax=Vandammella animalimorsus TaxID=2029117 RepID=A0A2A2AFX7_9BURK|nr:type I polyketide synthase [Vandammella animalimorsus]PAT36632.1 type I polyketide synthase WcbR [Vandammella animalimorsus]